MGPSCLTATIESKSSEKVGLPCTSEKGQVNVATSSNVKLRSSHLEGHPGRVLDKYWYKVTEGKCTRMLTAAIHRESKTLGTPRGPWQADPWTAGPQPEQSEGERHTLRTPRGPWQADPWTAGPQPEQSEGGTHTLAARGPGDKVKEKQRETGNSPCHVLMKMTHADVCMRKNAGKQMHTRARE